MNDGRITVLYIGGSSRTGSTLLDRLFGQINGYFSVGEIRHLWEKGLGQRQLCGCGRPVPECEFWSAVGDEAFGGFRNIDAGAMLALKQSVDHWSRLPLLMLRSWPPGFQRRVEEYAGVLGRLYRAVQRVSGCSVVVDSSKYPTHGVILNRMPEIDLYPIHLVRDSRAVAFSWQKKWFKPEVTDKREPMPNYNPFLCASEYLVMNLSLQQFTRINPRYLRIRYEDFADHPLETLAQILSTLGLPFPGLQFMNDAKASLKPNHTVAGNPMRFKQGMIDVKPDTDWVLNMKRSHRSLVTALTFPLLRQYGYFGRKRLQGEQ